MKEFNGFEEILMAVIKNTAHAKGHSDEKRFDEAMKALFGKNYKVYAPQLNAGISDADIRKILKKEAGGESLEGAIKQVLKDQITSKPIKDVVEREAQRARDEKLYKAKLEAVKKHINRHRTYYAWSEPVDFETTEEESVKEKQKTGIFEALRNAGWPI